uniref:Uncharacterized protein n=1 Tax=Lygus hesperus TaxID=30085 RepID=A0A0A9ZD21_LYGHE
MHLIDQLIPDKLDEVDRDVFGEMLLANPYTAVVQINTAVNDSDDDRYDRDGKVNASGQEKEKKSTTDEETELEVYGLSSVLDLAHGVRRYPAALQSLYDLLHSNV